MLQPVSLCSPIKMPWMGCKTANWILTRDDERLQPRDQGRSSYGRLDSRPIKAPCQKASKLFSSSEPHHSNCCKDVCNRISRVLHRLRKPAGAFQRNQGFDSEVRMLWNRKQGFVQLKSGTQLILTSADTASSTITTSTKAASFPSLLRQKRSAIQTIQRSDMNNEAVISVTCPECGRKEVRYSAVQLRSADEGSTIFYNCDCGNKYVELELRLRLMANMSQMEYE